MTFPSELCETTCTFDRRRSPRAVVAIITTRGTRARRILRSGVAPITDPRLLLRSALPNPLDAFHPLARVEDALMEHAGDVKTRGMTGRGAFNEMLNESVEEQAVPARLKLAEGAVRKAISVLRSSDVDSIALEASKYGHEDEARTLVKEVDSALQDILGTISNDPKVSPESLEPKFSHALYLVGKLQALTTPGAAYAVPSAASEPLIPADMTKPLTGRAWVDITVRNAKTGERKVVRTVVDGFNAPIAGGRFMELARSGNFNGKLINRADGFFVAFGEEIKDSVSAVPLEVKLADDVTEPPIYGMTLDDAGMRNARVALPFNAYGTLAMSHKDDDVNSGTTQFFFLTKESEITPSGTNVLDGSYSVIGYAVDGAEQLGALKAGDVIESVKEVR